MQVEDPDAVSHNPMSSASEVEQAHMDALKRGKEQPAAPADGTMQAGTGIYGNLGEWNDATSTGAVVKIAGKEYRLGAKQLLIAVAVVVAVVLLVGLIGDLVGSSGGDAPLPAPAAPAPPAGYRASFTDVCGKTEQQMGLTAVGNYPFFRGALPSGATLNGNAWLDDNFGVSLDGAGDSVCLGDHSAEGWAEDGDFTISYSFTKAA